MSRSRRAHPPGFSLVELLVVIAIIAILIGLLLPAVQKVREAANRSRCQNNIKNLALAINSFHEANGTFPTYNGVYPANTTNATPTLPTASGNTGKVHGSWIVHLLPYIEQKPTYDEIANQVTLYTNTGNAVSFPGGGWASPPVPAVAGTPQPPPGVEYKAANFFYSGTTGGASTPIPVNGASVVIQSNTSGSAAGWYQPSATATAYESPPGTYWSPTSVPTTGGSAAIPGVPNDPSNAPFSGYVGVYNTEIRSRIIKSLICPSDPSPGTDASANFVGWVYTTTANAITATGGPWASTNYLANWNALAANTLSGTTPNGVWDRPQMKRDVVDGMSNTILLSEGYAWCGGRGRTAFLAWSATPSNGGNGGYAPGQSGIHNFGLTFAIASGSVTTASGGGGSLSSATYGLPNPGGDPDVNFLFQIRPAALKPQPIPKPATLPKDVCPDGVDCCNNLTVQSGHNGLSVAMLDGSVRAISAGLSTETWKRVMLPRDGNEIGPDW